MNYFNFKQLLNDAKLDDQMKINLVDTSIKKDAWNSIGNYIDYIDNLEQFNDDYVGRITYEPEFDANNSIISIRIEIHHPGQGDLPEKTDWMIWEVVNPKSTGQ